jgi:hypothetical protein
MIKSETDIVTQASIDWQPDGGIAVNATVRHVFVDDTDAVAALAPATNTVYRHFTAADAAKNDLLGQVLKQVMAWRAEDLSI